MLLVQSELIGDTEWHCSPICGVGRSKKYVAKYELRVDGGFVHISVIMRTPAIKVGWCRGDVLPKRRPRHGIQEKAT